MAQYVAEFQSISKQFKGGFLSGQPVLAVDDVSFGLEEGETFCLIGPNGAGKTTLVRLLLDFIRPTAGRALLFGKPNSIPTLRDSLGYLPERPRFPLRMSVREFLWHWGRFSGMEKAGLRGRIKEVLELVNLNDSEKAPLANLSKGMAVRVGIAQALIHDPPLLVLDEPSDGLDPLARIQFREILLALKSKGKTVLLNSHLLSEVENTATRVAILDKGQIIAIDTLGKLTGSDATTSIRFSCSVPEHISELRTKYVVEEVNGDWRLTLGSGGNLDETLKDLMSRGAFIESVDRKRNLLEEKFRSLVQWRE